MVDFSREDLAFLAAAILSQAYITPRLPKPPEGGIISFLNDSTTQSLLVIGAIFLILHSAWNFGRELLSKEEGGGVTAGVEVMKGPPSNTLYVAVIRYGGVDWDAQFGTTRGNPISYVEGPYCPQCETELSLKNKHRRIRSKQRLWKCNSCGFTTSRETDTRDSQREVVEKIVENEADDAIRNVVANNNSEIEETLQEIIVAATKRESEVEEFLENPGPETFTDEVHDAIFEAIEEVVDEKQIRQDPTLRVVLRKRFGYTLPDQDRNYELLDEDIDESQAIRYYQ